MDTFDEEAWAAMIGPKNTHFYLERFRAMAAGGGAVGWHWPAFLFTGIWLLYRKMWAWALAYLVLLPMVGAIVVGFVSAAIGHTAVAALMNLALVAVLYLAPPLLATRLYYLHCQNKMTQLRLSSASRQGYLTALSSRGSTSLVTVLLLFVVPLIGILAAVAIPAYQDYKIRSTGKLQQTVKSSEGVNESTARGPIWHLRFSPYPRTAAMLDASSGRSLRFLHTSSASSL